MSAQEAKAAVKEKIKSLENEYVSLKTGFFSLHYVSTSPDIMRWFDVLEAIHAGNFLWSIECPRYTAASGNEYKQYLDRRLSEGAHFSEASTEFHAISTL